MNWTEMNQLKLSYYNIWFLIRFVLNLWFRKCQKSWANLLSCINRLMKIFNIINLHNFEKLLHNQQILWFHLQKQIHFQEIQLQSFMILWISTVYNFMLQLIQKNERITLQKMHVLTAIKKNISIKIVSQIHTIKYIKLSYSMKMNKLLLSEKHTSHSW